MLHWVPHLTQRRPGIDMPLLASFSQVPGCSVDLTQLRSYFLRQKICGEAWAEGAVCAGCLSCHTAAAV